MGRRSERLSKQGMHREVAPKMRELGVAVGRLIENAEGVFFQQPHARKTAAGCQSQENHQAGGQE
jgi:hypothetical protein